MGLLGLVVDGEALRYAADPRYGLAVRGAYLVALDREDADGPDGLVVHSVFIGGDAEGS